MTGTARNRCRVDLFSTPRVARMHGVKFMIGAPDSLIIAGYAVPQYEFDGKEALDPKTIGAIKDAQHVKTVLEAVQALQKLVVNTVLEVKKSQRKRKDDLERTKNDTMSSTASEIKRQEYLFKTYVPQLRTIGVSKAALEPAISNLKLADLFKERCKTVEPKFVWLLAPAWTQVDQGLKLQLAVSGVKITLLHCYMGASAYEISIEKGTGVQRAVYKKKLGPFSDGTDYTSGPNEYVKDDNGCFTRRYAYGYKTLSACKYLMETEGAALKGRYAQTQDIKSIDKDLRRMYTLPNTKQALSKEEMLFVNQEKGSGDQQRGICLSSSPNKVIHGNKGETFAFDKESNKANILLKVDLAQVPEGDEQLFNLYSQEAQTKTIGIEGTKPTGEKFSAAWAKQHTDTSTAKNREIFLRELKKSQVGNAEQVQQDIKALS